MKFGTVAALVALAVGASAQTPVAPAAQNSVIMVLATALPADSRSYALASGSAFAAEMASSMAAGNTPAWYQALPSDVKNMLPSLYPLNVVASATPTPSASASSSVVTLSSVSTSSSVSNLASSGTPILSSVSAYPSGYPSASGNSTAVHAPTLSASGTKTAKPTAAEATGAAPYPSAAVGATLGAALGFLGMLVL